VKAADKFVKTPLIYDEGYIDFLLDYCRENDVSAVISLFDIDLPVLAKNRKKFEELGIKLVVSSEEVVKICNDKLLTAEFCNKVGVAAPFTSTSIEETKKALLEGRTYYPIMIKPRRGMGSLSMYVAENDIELEVLYKKVLKGISSSYLKYEASHVAGEEVLFQQMIKGQEYGLDVVNDLNGNFVKVLGKKKLAMRAGETDSAVTVKSEEFDNIGKILSENLRHIGNLDVDVIKDSVDGKCYLIEMNARFGGGYPFSHNAGADVPRAIIKWLLGREADSSLFEIKEGVKAQKDLRITEI
jgi:carbamoyl-phosphate synthase large subunit